MPPPIHTYNPVSTDSDREMVMRFRMSMRSRICQARCLDIPVWTAKASRIPISTAKSARAPNGWENAREQITAAHIYSATIGPSCVTWI